MAKCIYLYYKFFIVELQLMELEYPPRQYLLENNVPLSESSSAEGALSHSYVYTNVRGGGGGGGILLHIWFSHDVPHYDNCIIAWDIRLGLLTMTLFSMARLVSIPLLYIFSAKAMGGINERIYTTHLAQ